MTARASRICATTRPAFRLGNPANNQTPARHRGNYAFYAVADQMIWRGADPDRNINVFVRPMFTPLEDRNLISFELNAGLTMRDPLQGRKDDTAGLAHGRRASQQQRDRVQPGHGVL